MRIFRLLISLAFLVSALRLNAQNAPLRGRISDSSGAVIPGSKIKVLKGSDVVAEATTNTTGDFNLELATGEYQIEVNAPEFNPLRQELRAQFGECTPYTRRSNLAKVGERDCPSGSPAGLQIGS